MFSSTQQSSPQGAKGCSSHALGVAPAAGQSTQVTSWAKHTSLPAHTVSMAVWQHCGAQEDTPMPQRRRACGCPKVSTERTNDNTQNVLGIHEGMHRS